MRLIRLLKNDLARESSDWVKQEIISLQQAEQICQNYGVDYHQAQARTLGYSVLMGLGLFFIGLSLIVLIGANWDEIPRFTRMSGLILLTLLTQCFGLYKWRNGQQLSATGVFFLGNMFFGASIILIAQIYHLGEHMPDGVYWWALGCLPFALFILSRLLMVQSLMLAIIWLFMEATEGYLTLGFAPFALSALWILYEGKSSLVLLLMTVFSWGFWLECLLAWYWSDKGQVEWHPELFVVVAALFLFVWLLGHWLSRQTAVKAKEYGAALVLWSLRFALFSLLTLSFSDVWKVFVESGWHNLKSLTVLMAVFLIPVILLAVKVKQQWLTVIVGSYLLLSLLLVLQGSIEHIYTLQIADNLLLIAFSIGLIIQGIRQGYSHYFFTGISAILLTALLRYIDLIGDYMGGSLLFLAFAVLLLGAAKYWKHHQLQQTVIENDREPQS